MFDVKCEGWARKRKKYEASSPVSELKKKGVTNCRIEGKESNDWKLVDVIDIIVHIFNPEKREFYDLENMWSEPNPKEKASVWKKSIIWFYYWS